MGGASLKVEGTVWGYAREAVGSPEHWQLTLINDPILYWLPKALSPTPPEPNERVVWECEVEGVLRDLRIVTQILSPDAASSHGNLAEAPLQKAGMSLVGLPSEAGGGGEPVANPNISSLAADRPDFKFGIANEVKDLRTAELRKRVACSKAMGDENFKRALIRDVLKEHPDWDVKKVSEEVDWAETTVRKYWPEELKDRAKAEAGKAPKISAPRREASTDLSKLPSSPAQTPEEGGLRRPSEPSAPQGEEPPKDKWEYRKARMSQPESAAQATLFSFLSRKMEASYQHPITVKGLNPDHPETQLILDIYLPKHNVCIEVDGPSHAKQEASDEERTQALKEQHGIETWRLKEGFVREWPEYAEELIELRLEKREASTVA